MKSSIDILYVANNVAFFVSHRLPIALAARDQGYLIDLITGSAGSKIMEASAVAKLEEMGLSHERISFGSASINPVMELIAFIQLIKKINKIRPKLIHCISPKGIIHGGIAARFTNTKNLVLAISGMGFAFTKGNSSHKLRSIIANIYSLLFKFVLRHPNVRVIVQNKDDQRSIIGMEILDADKIFLIPGSGIELEKFIHSKIENKSLIVLLPARMSWDKGVGEFIEAIKQIKSLMPQWRFILAGAADYQHPASVPIELLEGLNAKNLIEWIGYVEDMTPYFSKASIVCLPSYREGMPKCLLEGAAAGCAIVTTDAIGCREAILPGISGLIVPLRDSEALKNALYLLMSNRELRESLGRSGRELAINKFGLDKVVGCNLDIYKQLLKI